MALRKLLYCIAVVGWLFATGCTTEFWDPKQVGRFRSVPVQHVILDSLGLAEETPPEYIEAEPPLAEDVVAEPQDYKLNSGDVVRIVIYELLEENQPYINDFIITETGKISIPEVGTIAAKGLTEQQLEEEIRQILAPDILKTPAVTVTLQASEYRAYSVLGTGLLSDSGGGRFIVPRYNFRLNQAIATAGGISEYNVSYIYVTRQLTEKEIMERLGTGESQVYIELESGQAQGEVSQSREQEDEFDAKKAEEELLELIAPTDMGENSLNRPLLSLADIGEAGSEEETRVEWIFEGGRWVPVKVDSEGNPLDDQPGGEDGITVQNPLVPETESTEPDLSGLEDVLPDNYNMAERNPLRYMVRVIKIPREPFMNGDPRFNIIIKPGDTITIPSDSIGEFAILGNVNGPGYYTLTGRPMTLMQAIAAAGGLGELASPENVEVRRRIGAKHEEIVKVNLKKIASGLQPDFFIKENDTINVGTDSAARWLLILRNAFGANYGFSLTYSRNFADRDFYTSRPFNLF
ncbi:MAG: polysaccharide biosynthesis/export family protein [Sedimentisphaeraceae bacterium JB056]